MNIYNELAVLFSCTRIYLNSCAPDDLLETISRDIDWDRFLDEAIRHRLLYFAFKVMDIHARELVPGIVLSKMKKLCAKNSNRTLVQGVSLIRLLNFLYDNGISAMPFKGPVLSQMIYGSEDARIFSDLDILVSAKDAIHARDLLLANDFETDIMIRQSQENLYLQQENFFHLFNSSASLNIDLHWELTGRYSQKYLFFEDIMKNSKLIMFCDQSVSTLGYEETLIYLCIHGTSHCWNNLEMVFCVAAIITFHRDKIVWENVIEKANDLGTLKMLLLGLKLAAFFFHISLPVFVKAKIANGDANEGIGKLSRYVLTKMYYHKKEYSIETSSWRFSPLHFMVRDDISDAITYAGRLLFQPTITDWQLHPLPDNWLYLYHIIRPFRLIKEGLLGCHRK